MNDSDLFEEELKQEEEEQKLKKKKVAKLLPRNSLKSLLLLLEKQAKMINFSARLQISISLNLWRKKVSLWTEERSMSILPSKNLEYSQLTLLCIRKFPHLSEFGL